MADQVKVGLEIETIKTKVSEAKPDLDNIIKNGIETAVADTRIAMKGEAADVLTTRLLPGWKDKADGVVKVLDTLVENLDTANKKFNQQQEESVSQLQNKYSLLGL